MKKQVRWRDRSLLDRTYQIDATFAWAMALIIAYAILSGVFGMMNVQLPRLQGLSSATLVLAIISHNYNHKIKQASVASWLVYSSEVVSLVIMIALGLNLAAIGLAGILSILIRLVAIGFAFATTHQVKQRLAGERAGNGQPPVAGAAKP